MKITAQIIGLFAVTAFLLSYQQKKRKNIILWNATSRFLYIVQYIVLGAFEGAALDIMGIVSSVAAHRREHQFIKKHLKTIVVIINLIMLAVGLSLYENVFSLFSIAGVILHTSAFWITDEKRIRRLSLAGSPFWLVYNLANYAYGSALGDVLSIVSICIAIFRYDIKAKKHK